MSSFHRYLFFGFIALTTIFAYFHALDNPFTYLDDQEQVVNNPNIQKLSLEHLKAIFSSTSVGMYQPISTLGYALVYALGGLEPSAYHWASVLLHLINGLLVFELLRRLKVEDWSALLLTSIFLLHPMQVESVAWVSAFSNLVFTSFFLLSLSAYLEFLNGKKGAYWLSLLFFLLSGFSKATAVTLPIVLILLDRWHYGEWRWKKQWNKLPFLALSVVFGIITINSRASAGHLSDLSQSFDWHHRIFLISRSLSFYFEKFIFPYELSAFYPYPELSDGFFDLLIYLSLPLILLLLWLLYRYRKEKRILLGGLFFFIALAPTLHFIPVGNQLTADRYIYLPMVALLIIISKAIQKWPVIGKQLGLILLSLVLGSATFYRAQIWENDLTIWEDVLEKYPKVAQAHNNLGSYMLLLGKKQEAFRLFNLAIELKPNYADAYNNRGNLLSQAGKSEAAMADFNRAITLRPHADAYFNRANELSKNGNLNLAIEDYSQSIKLKASPDAYTNRAFAYLKTKDLGSCKADLNRALAMDGTYHPAYFLLAMEARQRNDFETACKNLRLAARYGNQKAERALPELCLNNSP
jgi:tetratricopeptide (TPR) repeat protein